MKFLFYYHAEELASHCNLNVICKQSAAQVVSVPMRKNSLYRYHFLQNISLLILSQKNINTCRKS